jgi:alginate O-acetyltransferase complex protein AlgI
VNFLSVQFALFLAIVVPAYYLCPSRRRPLFLLLASYAFYILSSPLAAIGIFVATAFAFWMGGVIEARQNQSARGTGRAAMALAVTLLVFYLSFYKTLAPLANALGAESASGGWVGILARNAVLPLGISYYTFKLISYLVDVYWNKIPAERSFIAFAAYAAFFPQIVAGPIQRSGDFLNQIHMLSPSTEMFKSGLRRVLIGCFKKAVVADNLGHLMDTAYAAPGAPHSSTLLAFYVFPLQLYADFSALTDIAVGTARLFGIQSPENFQEPFLATSISQYWRRWHMSLTTWLTDYVFLPLRMATRNAGNWGLAFSLMVNMVLIGLWHSLSWTFFIFGVLHGFFLIVDALTSKRRSKFFKTHTAWDCAASCAGPVFTFHLVALAMVFVRAASLEQAWDVLSRLRLQEMGGTGISDNNTLYGLAGLTLWLFAWISLKVQRRSFKAFSVPAWGRWAFYYAVIAMIVKYGHNAEGFIYFKF